MEHTEKKSQKKTSQSQNAGFLFAVGLGVAAIIGLVIWYVLGIQSVKALSESRFAEVSSRVFNIPVATINGNKIGYHEYVDNLRAMRTFFDTDTEGLERPTDADMSDYVLSRLLVNGLITQVARDFRVSLSREEINSIVERDLLSSFASKEEAEQEIITRYGWTFDEFVQKIVVPTELERKLSEVYIASVGSTGEEEVVRAQAEDILAQIKDGASFEEMAREYGTDGTSAEGGDLGWFARGVMVPEFEEAVFSLGAGDLADELVQTQFGYHIVKVDDYRIGEDPMTGEEVEEVKARHILFRVTGQDIMQFREYMNGLLMDATITVAKGLKNPFEDLYEEVGSPNNMIDVSELNLEDFDIEFE
jgi:hypothetical protein